MFTRAFIRRWFCAFFAIALLAGTLGVGCDFNLPIFGPDNDVVTVELVNESSFVVTPALWADPDLEYATANVALDANFVDIGPPMDPGEVVTVELRCADAGTLLADADFASTPVGDLAGGLLLRDGEHFSCGDTVTYFYRDPPVTVELTDLTSNFVDAYLWSDPGTLFTPEEVAIPANAVDIGPSLAPDERVTAVLECIDAGTILADGDLITEPVGTPIASDNLVLVRWGEHYQCGDVVSFYYEVDGVGGFFITVDVNDVTIPF